MYKANLSFAQLNDYVTFLLKTKMMAQTTVDGKETYKITKTGQHFLQKHSELIQMLKSKDDMKEIEIPIKPLNKRQKA